MFSSQSNLEILYQVLDEYTIKASESITVPPELENYQFSKRFEKHMQRLINRQKKSYYMLIDTVGKRVACYVVVVLTCLFVTVFSVKALREPFISFVVRTYEKFTSIFVDKDTIDTRAASTDFEIMLPTYIPEGYEVVERRVYENTVFLKYENLDKNFIIYKQHLDESAFLKIDTQNTEYQKIYIEGVEAIYYQKNEVIHISFKGKECIFEFECMNISNTEIKKIIKSIK